MSYLKHSFEFTLVLVILVVALILLEIFRVPFVRFFIISSMSFLYVVYGIVHHWEEKNLRFSQVLEHLAIGFLLFVILAGLYN